MNAGLGSVPVGRTRRCRAAWALTWQLKEETPETFHPVQQFYSLRAQGRSWEKARPSPTSPVGPATPHQSPCPQQSRAVRVRVRVRVPTHGVLGESSGRVGVSKLQGPRIPSHNLRIPKMVVYIGYCCKIVKVYHHEPK